MPWLAAVAIVPILATVYQTLVLTDVSDDLIRLGINAEHYSMIWTNVSWGVAIIYGVFAGIWAMARYGAGTPCWSDSPGLRRETCSAGRRPIWDPRPGEAGGGRGQRDGDRALPLLALPPVRHVR